MEMDLMKNRGNKEDDISVSLFDSLRFKGKLPLKFPAHSFSFVFLLILLFIKLSPFPLIPLAYCFFFLTKHPLLLLFISISLVSFYSLCFPSFLRFISLFTIHRTSLPLCTVWLIFEGWKQEEGMVL
jgi:hypothetical protein